MIETVPASVFFRRGGTFQLRRWPIDTFGDLWNVSLDGAKRTEMCNTFGLSHNMNVE